MSTERDREEALRSTLEQCHQVLDPPAPSFEGLWKGAVESHRLAKRPLRRPAGVLRWPTLRWALAAGLCCAVAFPLVRMTFPTALLVPGSAMTEQEALSFAEELDDWASSLEFLDQAPGMDLFDSFPELSPTFPTLKELSLDELQTMPGLGSDPNGTAFPPAA